MIRPSEQAIEDAIADGALPLYPREEFDCFIFGIGGRGMETVLVYDSLELLQHLASIADPGDDDQDPTEAAMEHFEQSLSLGGEGRPIFVAFSEDIDSVPLERP